MSGSEDPVELRPIDEKSDAVIINFKKDRKLCRKCKGELFGGEIEYGVCDLCTD